MAPTLPSQVDTGGLELHSTASEPWLDVQIAHASRSVARIRQADLKLGKRLKLAPHGTANGVPPRTTLQRPTHQDPVA